MKTKTDPEYIKIMHIRNGMKTNVWIARATLYVHRWKRTQTHIQVIVHHLRKHLKAGTSHTAHASCRELSRDN